MTYLPAIEPVTPFNSTLPGLPNVPQSTLMTEDGSHGVDVSYLDSAGEELESHTVRTVNFDWVSAFFLQSSILYPEEQYRPSSDVAATRWETTFTAPAAGEYTFDLHASGASSVAVDGDEVISFSPTGTQDRSTPSAPAMGSGVWSVTLDEGEEVEFVIESAIGRSGKISFGWAPPESAVAPSIAAAAEEAASADVVIVVVTDFNAEGTDKPHLHLPGSQEALVEEITRVNENTVVVLNTGGPLVLPFADDASAVIQSFYPGQSAGTALAQVLWGDVDPAGRLPLSMPASDEANLIGAEPSRYPLTSTQVPYTEGHLTGYRWHDSEGIEPQFHFGHGLSYADFAMTDLAVTPVKGNPGFFEMDATLTNTSSRTGTAVPQLYVGLPRAAGAAPRQLRGFDKISLAAGESVTVSFTVDPRDLAYWDEAQDGWLALAGDYQLSIGTSSAAQDQVLVAEVSLTEDILMGGDTELDPRPVDIGDPSEPPTEPGDGGSTGPGDGNGQTPSPRPSPLLPKTGATAVALPGSTQSTRLA